MTRYLYRTCPKCNNYLDVVAVDPKDPAEEVEVDAKCVVCGYVLPWMVMQGKRVLLACMWVVLVLFSQVPTVSPDGGGLDDFGCHRDRQRGGYHCHDGQFKGRSFGSKIEMLREGMGREPSSPRRPSLPSKPSTIERAPVIRPKTPLKRSTLATTVEKPTRPVETFQKAKTVVRDKVYFDRQITFYCRCFFDSEGNSGGVIDPSDCGFKFDGKRTRQLEWEHVVPASRLANQRACWTEGHPRCISGRPNRKYRYKGRRCCETMGGDDQARFMLNDLHNLVPSIGQVYGDRSNYPYGVVEGEPRAYGSSDFEIGGSPKVAEPAPHIRGNVARISLYMSDTWGVPLTEEETEMFKKWDTADPVGEWEKVLDSRIKAIQGNLNRFVSD